MTRLSIMTWESETDDKNGIVALFHCILNNKAAQICRDPNSDFDF